MARVLCVVAFACQVLLPALHPSHGGSDAAAAHVDAAHGAVDVVSVADAAAAAHNAQGCTLCAALAAGRTGLVSPPTALGVDGQARFTLGTTVAAPCVAAPLTRAAPRGPPLLVS